MVVLMPRASSFARIRHPDVEILAAVAGRGVDEAGAGVVGDVIAFEQRHVEFVAAVEPRADARIPRFADRSAGNARDPQSRNARLLEHVARSLSARIRRSPAWPNCPRARR
jgi:hypothetical protein